MSHYQKVLKSKIVLQDVQTAIKRRTRERQKLLRLPSVQIWDQTSRPTCKNSQDFL